MKKLFLILLLLGGKAFAQLSAVKGKWCSVGMDQFKCLDIGEKQVRFSDSLFPPAVMDNDMEDFADSILSIVSREGYTGIIHRENNEFPIEMMFIQQTDSGYIDLFFDCSQGDYDSVDEAKKAFETCRPADGMRLRFYSVGKLKKFGLLKKVATMPATERSKVSRQYQEATAKLREEIQRDEELVWVAPLIFRQYITDILLAMNYNPVLSAAELKDIFSFEW